MSFSRSVYEEAQSRSSRQLGSALHQSFASASTTSKSNGFGSRGSARSSRGSSHASVPGVSLSGHRLVQVKIEEEPELELDRDEIRRLARGGAEGTEEDDDPSSEDLPSGNDASTIGTTRSARSAMSGAKKPSRVVDVDPRSAVLSHDAVDRDAGGDVEERARQKLEGLLLSPPFRRSLFLGTCFVLLGLGVLLTLENFTRVRTARDWIEPERDRYSLYDLGRGIDWAFGSDAPKPNAGASIDRSLEDNIANWAHDTARVPAASSLDGYGSVALSSSAMFRDVPFFWGLPFAGGSILEAALGGCLHLVQASDRQGDGLRLSTSFVMGMKYLNVDLSNTEGIERARVLALGTSAIADVIHSPLLHEASSLFATTNKGRLFVIVRHPAEREFARFRYLRRSGHGKGLKEADWGMSYEEFSLSDYVADDWMTRSLVRKGPEEELTMGDMQTAKEILRRKALVGLHSDIAGAVRHFARYFRWDKGGRLSDGTLACLEGAILEGMRKETKGTSDLRAEEAQEGSAAWRRLMERNKFDSELFIYSQQLYKFQIALS
ncbi:hypothetical protein ACHAWF_017181 [Thalassiosira exigua]